MTATATDQGRALKQLRLVAGLTLEDLAARVSTDQPVSAERLHQIEEGVAAGTFAELVATSWHLDAAATATRPAAGRRLRVLVHLGGAR